MEKDILLKMTETMSDLQGELQWICDECRKQGFTLPINLNYIKTEIKELRDVINQVD